MVCCKRRRGVGIVAVGAVCRRRWRGGGGGGGGAGRLLHDRRHDERGRRGNILRVRLCLERRHVKVPSADALLVLLLQVWHVCGGKWGQDWGPNSSCRCGVTGLWRNWVA
eukprot:366386-Chlamydomonas_euryale.AAC.2